MPDNNLDPRTAVPENASPSLTMPPAKGSTRETDAEELLQQLRLLRQSPLSGANRARLLDRLYIHLAQLVETELPMLEGMALPLQGAVRQRTSTLQSLLALLAEMYLARFPDDAPQTDRLVALERSIRCMGWHIAISHLVSAPTQPGIWRDLHAAYRLARKLGLARAQGEGGGDTLEASYVRILMSGIAQPASFSASELGLVAAYIENSLRPPEISDIPPLDRGGVFWIDLASDLPAHALNRRAPTNDIPALYFACDVAARALRDQIGELRRADAAENPGLPEMAGSPAGLLALGRLAEIWGNPAKRRFPRRRQSYRVALCAAFNPLWQSLRTPANATCTSEWMVTNESPDGYSLMHVGGSTDQISVGDVVAVRPKGETSAGGPAWHVGIVRWAISENPEHIEIGLQQVATRALAATIIRPGAPENGVPALILPEMPSIRTAPELLVETATTSWRPGEKLLLLDHASGSITDIRVTAIADETSRIAILSVVPDEMR